MNNYEELYRLHLGLRLHLLVRTLQSRANPYRELSERRAQLRAVLRRTVCQWNRDQVAESCQGGSTT